MAAVLIFASKNQTQLTLPPFRAAIFLPARTLTHDSQVRFSLRLSKRLLKKSGSCHPEQKSGSCHPERSEGSAFFVVFSAACWADPLPPLAVTQIRF
jgi:hypothetical protein